ncbi:MAG: hypothetical protein R3E60_01655 [Alphaproteobacteria bacterium]
MAIKTQVYDKLVLVDDPLHIYMKNIKKLLFYVTLCMGILPASLAHSYIIERTEVSTVYEPQLLGYAGAGGRDIWTIILGNPFSVPQAIVNAIIVESMHGSHFGPDVDFTTMPAPGDRRYMRVVILINGSTSSADDVCEYYPQRPLGPGYHDHIKVMMVFCNNEIPLSSVIGKVDVQNPDDKEFRSFIRQMTVALFPPRNPRQEGHGTSIWRWRH